MEKEKENMEKEKQDLILRLYQFEETTKKAQRGEPRGCRGADPCWSLTASHLTGWPVYTVSGRLRGRPSRPNIYIILLIHEEFWKEK